MVCEICGKESPKLQPYSDADKVLVCEACGEARAKHEEEERRKSNYGRTVKNVQVRVSEEQKAFERAVPKEEFPQYRFR